MRLQVLSSGSRGNCALVRAGECTLLVDAGLGPMAMRERLKAAGLAPYAVDHVLVTHAHGDKKAIPRPLGLKFPRDISYPDI